MAQEKLQILMNMTNRQKAIAGALILVLIVLVWQISGLFGGGTTTQDTIKPTANLQAPAQQQLAPQPAPLPKPVMTQREAELLQQQQQIEAKYIAALNELQMLKLEKEIAETNKAIIDAKLGTVTAQKNIVDMLAPPPPPQVSPAGYAQSLATGQPVVVTSDAPPIKISQPQEVSYTVVSISRIKSRWSAVLGYQTNLYYVSIGDVLPADGSKVVSIDRSGVILQKNGVRKKVSLVPII